MAAKDFLLKYAGQTKTLAAWGIEDCEFESNDFAADTVTFTVAGRALDASDLFAYGSTVEIFFPDGVTRWFYGRVEPWERNGSGQSLEHFGRLVGPWFYLELTYKARFILGGGAGQPAKTYLTPRVILNAGQGAAGGFFVKWTTGQQLADVVNYFNSLGFPLKLGYVAPWSSPFTSAQQGITGAEVIRMMFQREPDFTCVWDYSTTPPTIHFLKGNNQNLAPGANAAQLVLPPQTVNLAALAQDQIKIKPRPDLLRSFVHLYYEQQGTVNGQQYLSIVEDVYPNPPPSDPQSLATGLDMLINLQGGSSSSQIQTCEFTSQPFDPTDINQWIKWKASLDDADVVSAVVLTADNTDDAINHPPPITIARDDEPLAYDDANAFEITNGSWAPWMSMGKLAVTAQKVRVSAWIKITKQRGANAKQQTEYISVHADFVATSYNTASAPQNFFIATQTVQAEPEGVPIGLAQSMYLAWRTLSIEGSMAKVEGVLTSPISRGFVLNFLTPNQPAWANAQSIVRHVSGSIDRGTTKIEFGAKMRINGLALLDILRSTRYRQFSAPLSYYFGGPSGGAGGGSVTNPQKHHPRSIEHSTSQDAVHVITGKVNPVQGTDPIILQDGTTGVTSWYPPAPVVVPPKPATGQVIVDPAKSLGSDGKWHTVQIQPMKVCATINGVQKQRSVLVLCSDIFQGPDDPA